MPKLAQAVSIIALAAATSTAGAWCDQPDAYAMTHELAEQQMQAISAQHQAMAEQHAKAIEQAMDAQRQMMEQRSAHAARMPSGPQWAFPEVPPVPEFGQYPAMPEMPAMPEIGQFPAMPEMPEMPAMPEFGQFPEMPEFAAMQGLPTPSTPELMKTRLEQRDAHRAKVQHDIKERRAAFKAMSAQRRAAHEQSMAAYGPGMHPAMMSNQYCAPKALSPEQQAAAPAPAATTAVQ